VGHVIVDVATTRVEFGGHVLELVHPRDAEALLDEEAFAREEFLPYWAELWPSGIALAEAVAERHLEGRRVLELGCGLALPSLAAALRGADVLAADWSPDAVRFARANARRNGLPLETVVASWARPEGLLARGPWDLVLAADVLYERRDVEPLLALLPHVVARGGEVLLAEPGRPAAKAFFAGARDQWDVDTQRVGGRPRVDLASLRLRLRPTG
jgi:predicted nicotinamide N-methyase